jgi:hypothetical protein
MDVNQKYCQSCHLISRNGFIIRYVANVWAILSRYQNAAAASREYWNSVILASFYFEMYKFHDEIAIRT